MRALALTTALIAGSFVPFAAPAADAVTPFDPSDTAAMLAYVRKDDPAFAWEVRGTKEMAGATIAELRLTSQKWRGIEWKHRVFVVKPAELRRPKQAVLFISGGKWRDSYATDEGMSRWPREIPLIAAGAAQAGTILAMVEQVPFQPMFDGKTEDALIAYSFSKWLETGENDWPLLFPMVKSAVRAMDTVQAFTRSKWSLRVENFAVTGASKRGWTTWLSGAADARVNAIAPMVIDVLNMGKQMPHQLAAWGAYSPMIADYTRRGLPGLASSAKGAQLLRMVDPWSYRDRLLMPKLLIIGTNDAYWPLDACNIYWHDLKGPKYLTYVPNNGHGVTDMARVLGAIGGMARASSGEQPYPNQRWSWKASETTERGLRLVTLSDTAPSVARIWMAHSKTRDFRQAKWTATEIEGALISVDGHEDRYTYTYEFAPPATGYTSCFAELVYPPVKAAANGVPLHLSTCLRILRSGEEEDF